MRLFCLEKTMPLSKHYGGHGEKVMKSMMKTYGPEKAKEVFYATENKRKAGKKNPYSTLRSKG